MVKFSGILRRTVRCGGAAFMLVSCAATAGVANAAPAPSGFARAHAHDLDAIPARDAAQRLGSSNVATAEPPVARPHTRPCYVKLFANYAFSEYKAHPFAYTPPAACPGPWAKVVFEGNFSVTPGRQYDRTADVWIGNTNVFFGTTPEPRRNLGPTWHVERDVTDLSALLRGPQPGEVEIFQVVNATYTGVIKGSTDLAFYPADRENPAPRTADVVLPLSGGYGGELVQVTAGSNLARTFTFPRNVENLELQVFSQSQSGDEFWYTCATSDLAAFTGCGNTAFRETEIAIDGIPAGVAPVYPWIYTGGIDPYLWEPIPGIQTLNFRPYRVDLTPFAGMLADGKPHSVSIGVYNAVSYFSVTGTLLVFQDRGAKTVGGGLLIDTLQTAPSPVVVEHVKDPSTAPVGTESVTSSRRFVIAGFTNTSHGRVDTRIEQSVDFSNVQKYDFSATLQVQDVTQATSVLAKTVTTDRTGVRTANLSLRYPLVVDTSATIAGPLYTLTTAIRQGLEENRLETFNGVPTFARQVFESVAPTDTLVYNLQLGVVAGHYGQHSTQTYRAFDSRGGCYGRRLASADNRLTAAGDVSCR